MANFRELLDGVKREGFAAKGTYYYVDPKYGSNSNSGSKSRPLKTIAAAEDKCVSGKGDVVVLMAYDNTSANTTDYLSATLTWDKDNTHLIGLCAASELSQRARIGQLSTATSVSPLFSVTGNGNTFWNFSVFQGVDNAASKGCTYVSGVRNLFKNVHIAGIGHATQDASAAYSLSVTGGKENKFEGCVIGLDTVARGTAQNAEIYFATKATRNTFLNCKILTFAEAAEHFFVDSGAESTMDRWTHWENCTFINPISSTAVAMTAAFNVHAAQGGLHLLKNCTIVGADDVASSDVGVYIDGAAPTNNTSALAVLVETT